MLHQHNEQYPGLVSYKKRFVLSTTYPEYHAEQHESYIKTNRERYETLWNERRIYKKIKNSNPKPN
jgi:hypothetical protein